MSNELNLSKGFNANGEKDNDNYITIYSGTDISCPFCFKVIDLSPLTYIKFSNENVQLVLKCKSCRNVFIGYTDYHPSSDQYRIVKLSKGNSLQKCFPEEIKKTSSAFVEIYNQSLSAENEKLILICGTGYRKALEYLIKDYLIFEYPDKKQEIEKKLLGTCITDYIDNHKIKEISKRAAWIGNDETHYTKKWDDKDLSDLKKLIDITVGYISSEILSKEYINNMSDRKKEE